jgi:hypothetical protein
MKKEAPFTDDEVASFNEYQKCGMFHPFTCCSYDDCNRMEQLNHGRLIATNEGLHCPCGKMPIQIWCHDFQVNWEWKKRGLQAIQSSEIMNALYGKFFEE